MATGLSRVPGVKSAEVDYNTRMAKVEYDPAQTNVEALKKAVRDMGYGVK